MSHTEQRRVWVLTRVAGGGLTVAEAAELLGLSTRSIRRLQARLEHDGPAGLLHKAHLQSLGDDAYGLFVADVAKGRGVSESKVRTGYGKGRAPSARDARREGLIDAITTLPQAIAEVTSRQDETRRLTAEWQAISR